MSINNSEAKIFTERIFTLIRNSETVEELIFIEKDEFEKKFRMDTNVYPKIKFDIQPTDLKELIEKGILNNDYSFKEDITTKLNDPLTKLLYSLAWKNGDLKKLKHIAKGISEYKKGFKDQEDAFVFYQFGKYLTKNEGQPIIDQHVIRAFSAYITNDMNDLTNIRNTATITKNQKWVIVKYIDWLKSDEISKSLKTEKDYSYHIDKILFATGKKIKTKKK